MNAPKTPTLALSQDQLKALVAEAAVAEILPLIQGGQIIGVGTGSTVNKFIDALAAHAASIKGAVSSSNATTLRLKAIGVPVVDAESVESLSVYVDGADEIDPLGCMIKGGGAALTREKIIAALAQRFVCIVDESKLVTHLGAFALPVEVIPMAAPQIIRQFAAMGGLAAVRMTTSGPLVTDNSQHILDVCGLVITDAAHFERTVNQWPGVVTVGVFAQQRAQTALVASPTENAGQGGVKRIQY